VSRFSSSPISRPSACSPMRRFSNAWASDFLRVPPTGASACHRRSRRSSTSAASGRGCSGRLAGRPSPCRVPATSPFD
jgi:hypothetical protein